jgi:hypothetical protein
VSFRNSWVYGKWSWYFTHVEEAPPATSDPLGWLARPGGVAEKWPPVPVLTLNDVHPPILAPFTLGEYRRTLRTLFHLTPLLRSEVNRVLASIGGPFTSLFVRRGCKILEEASYIPMSTILSYVPYDDDTVFFVQTDDYGVVEEMRTCLPTHTIHCTVPPTKRGSYHYVSDKVPGNCVPWTHKTEEDRRTETSEMLVGLSVCLAATQCWTDDTSNVGRFLKLCGDERVHIYPEDYTVDDESTTHPLWKICRKE